MLFRIACFLCCFDRWICIYHQHQSKKESCTVCNFGCGILMWSCLIFEVWNCLIFLQCLILHMPNIQLIFSLYSANIQLIASYIQLIFSYIQLIASQQPLNMCIDVYIKYMLDVQCKLTGKIGECVSTEFHTVPPHVFALLMLNM